MNSENNLRELEKLIAELHGKVLSPRRDEQLREGVVPPYLLDEYNRSAAAGEMIRLYPGNLSALGAISYAAMTDPATSVRLRCAKLIADTGWQGRDCVLVCCTYDPDPEVRLLALEAMAVNRLPCTGEVASRLTRDPDDFVSDLAVRLERGDLSWPVYKY